MCEIVSCDRCESEITGDPYPFDGVKLCEDCYHDDTAYCEDCDSTFWQAEIECVNGDHVVCEDCHRRNYCCCDVCGEEMPNDDAVNNDCGESFCSDCYHDAYTTCYSCECELHRDNAEYIDDEAYCDGCYRENQDDYSVTWSVGPAVLCTSVKRLHSTRKFGVEIEVSSAPDYVDLEGRFPWGATEDGTCGVVMEFCSPPMQGDDGLRQIEKFCDACNSRNFEVDRTCGLHLHIDMADTRQVDLTRLFMTYKYYERVWQSFVPESRRNNHFCEGIGFSANYIRQNGFRHCCDSTPTRFWWLNIDAYRKHGTIENRLHTGTTSAEKIVNWTIANCNFVESVMWENNYEFTREGLYEHIGDKSVCDYLESRYAKFN